MKTLKNTQGQWEMYPEALNHGLSYNKAMPFRCDVLGAFDEATNSRIIIASVYGRTKEEAEANAKLIAPAPKMLEALIGLRKWAIAKGINIDGGLITNTNLIIKQATE